MITYIRNFVAMCSEDCVVVAYVNVVYVRSDVLWLKLRNI